LKNLKNYELGHSKMFNNCLVLMTILQTF